MKVKLENDSIVVDNKKKYGIINNVIYIKDVDNCLFIEINKISDIITYHKLIEQDKELVEVLRSLDKLNYYIAQRYISNFRYLLSRISKEGFENVKKDYELFKKRIIKSVKISTKSKERYNKVIEFIESKLEDKGYWDIVDNNKYCKVVRYRSIENKEIIIGIIYNKRKDILIGLINDKVLDVTSNSIANKYRLYKMLVYIDNKKYDLLMTYLLKEGNEDISDELDIAKFLEKGNEVTKKLANYIYLKHM